MYARLSAVLFPVAVVFLIGAIVWGYQEHQEKNTVLIKAENQYQRAFHDLSNHMQRLHDEMGQTLAVSATSDGYQRRGLVNVWRLTSQAQNEINQLPLAMLPFNKTEQFLSRMSDFAYRTAVRDLKKQPLSSQEVRTLKSLYAETSEINKELGKVQDAVLKDRLRWMDVEVAMAAQRNPHDNTIIDGFRAVDKKIGAYPENDWGPSALSMARKRSDDQLSGSEATADQVKQQALEFVGMGVHAGPGHEVRVMENGKGTDLHGYTVTLKSASGDTIRMNFTRKGGHLLWYMNPREVKTRRLDAAAARTKAVQFLKTHGYPDMTPVTYDEYDNVAVFTFVGLKNNVRIYPDKVTARIALDNGEGVGLQAADHVFAPRVLDPGKPKLTREEARKKLHSDFRVDGYNLALIENEQRQQVLCHEFTGRINGNRYRIYVNADNGLEETIERIPDTGKALLH
jgi:spore germination protein